jgi:hypothetical protein
MIVCCRHHEVIYFDALLLQQLPGLYDVTIKPANEINNNKPNPRFPLIKNNGSRIKRIMNSRGRTSILKTSKPNCLKFPVTLFG